MVFLAMKIMMRYIHLKQRNGCITFSSILECGLKGLTKGVVILGMLFFSFLLWRIGILVLVTFLDWNFYEYPCIDFHYSTTVRERLMATITWLRTTNPSFGSQQGWILSWNMESKQFNVILLLLHCHSRVQHSSLKDRPKLS